MATSNLVSDTSAEARAVQIACLRKMTPQQRIEQTCQMSQRVKQMAFDAIRRRHPQWPDSEVRLRFIELIYGKSLAQEVRQWLNERNGH